MSHSNNEYKPPLCVWKVVEESASLEKLPIIRSAIGESKVEYANDLRLELDTLLEIWYELNSGIVLSVHYSKRIIGLPEPPQQRELLTTEIHLLLENLKDKERGGTTIMPSDLDETVINYANHIAEQRTPPITTPVLQSSSRNSSTPILNDEEIEDVAKNIPVLDNDGPINALRNALQHECDILLEDIEYVRRCVEEGRCDFEEIVEPSLSELRQERKKLENHVMKSIDQTPALSINDSKLTSSLKSRRKTSSAPKAKTLPPVRPSSASQFSKQRSHERAIVAPKLEPTQKTATKLATSPVLGSRSRTFPNENGMKLVTKLKRRNSASAILDTKDRKSNFPSDVSSNFEFNSGFDTLPSRRVFCGTPDSGVSSRPPSGLGMVDGAVSDSLEHLKSLTTNLSEIHISRSSATKIIEHSELKSNCYESLHGRNNTPVKSEARYSAAGGKTQVPQPPSQNKPRVMQSARFRRIKASGMHGS